MIWRGAGRENRTEIYGKVKVYVLEDLHNHREVLSWLFLDFGCEGKLELGDRHPHSSAYSLSILGKTGSILFLC